MPVHDLTRVDAGIFHAFDAPLETTYQSAFAAVPRRWRRVLEA